jgi:GAF domain-containing protein
MAPTPNRDSRGQSISISDAFGSQGKYNPGMTTEILADAFMRAMDIYEYGEDRHAAMQFVIDLALNNVNAMGGAVLLTDLNQPMSGLWFEVANGPGAEELLNFRIPFGKGIIGYCAQEGVSQIIPNAPQEPRFKDDVLHQVGINIGSMLCTPIQHQKRTFGVITLYKYPDLRPFTRGESSILEYLAHTAGEYIYNLVEKADN